MTTCKGLFFQLTKPKLKKLSLVFILEAIAFLGIILFVREEAKLPIRQISNVIILAFALIIAYILTVIEGEKIYRRNIYRSLPVSNGKLYLMNLLTSVLLIEVFFGLQFIFLENLPFEVGSFLGVSLTKNDGFAIPNLSRIINHFLVTADTFTAVSFVHLAGEALVFKLPKWKSGLVKFLTYVFVILLFASLTSYSEDFIGKFFHQPQAFFESGNLWQLGLITFEVIMGIFFMGFVETDETLNS